jgi:cell wall-associated NlpC family hydrolase
MKKTLHNFIKKIPFGLFVFHILLSGSIISFFSSPQKAEAQNAGECRVTQVKQEASPPGASYTRENRPIGKFTYRLRDCVGKTITFEMFTVRPPSNSEGWFSSIVNLASTAISSMTKSRVGSVAKVIVYPNAKITVDLRLGENECYDLNVGDNVPNCNLFTIARDGDTVLTNTRDDVDSELNFDIGFGAWFKGSLYHGVKYAYLSYRCPNGECEDGIKFELVSILEEDMQGVGLSDMNEIPPECQDEQGNLRPGCYKLLEPIGGFIDPVFDAEKQGIGGYVNTIIRLLLAVATLLAVLMIVVGGVQYMTTDAIGAKSEGILKMTNAVLGLILAFATYVILNTINPNILNLDPGIKTLTLELEGDTNTPLVSSPYVPPQVHCPKSGGSAVLPQVINSLEGKVTYRFGGKGGPAPYESETKMCTTPAPERLCREFCPDNTVCLDCSGFVNYVLKCAGLPTHNGGTGAMFTNAESITSISTDGKSINNILLKPGDIIGWKAGDGGNEIGHVLLYIGDGKVIESRGGEGRQPGNALLTTPLKDHSKKDSLKYVKRTP